MTKETSLNSSVTFDTADVIEHILNIAEGKRLALKVSFGVPKIGIRYHVSSIGKWIAVVGYDAPSEMATVEILNNGLRFK